MKKFKIYVFKNNKQITITDSVDSLSPVSTFDEKLTKQENGRGSLSFSVYKKALLDDKTIIENPFLPLLYQNAKVRYEDLVTNEILDFVITSISYTISKENVKYNIKAEDYASQIFSKRGKEMKIDFTGNIKEIAAEIFRIGNVNNQWAKEKQINENIWSDWTLEQNNFENNFPSPIDSTQPRRATLILDNTNMYNALVELALLFDARLKFDYKNHIIKFQNKQKEVFKGLRLRSDINLSSISVSDSNSNFSTVMQIIGRNQKNDQGYDYTLYPLALMPIEVKKYFATCKDNNFNSKDYLDVYDRVNNSYSSKLDFIMNNYYDKTTISELKEDGIEVTTEYLEERRKEVKDYLQLCDLFPHLENALIDIYYFYVIGALSEKKLKRFNKVLNDDIRKLNMEIKILSENYFNYNSQLLIKQTMVDNTIDLLTAAEKNLNETQKELAEETDETKKTRIQEEIDKITSDIQTHTDNINKMLSDEEFIKSVLHSYGKGKDEVGGNWLGFDKLIQDYTDQRSFYLDLYKTQEQKLKIAENKISKEEETSTAYFLLEQEIQSSKESNEKILDLIGKTAKEGHYSVGKLGHWIDFLTAAKNKVKTADYADVPSLYDLVINESYPENRVAKKKKILSQLYAEYDIYIIESVYQNSEEVSPYSLAEQAFLVFYGSAISTDPVLKNRHFKRYLGNSTPTRSYNLSIINLSDLEEFNYLNIDVGDMVEFNELALGISKEKVYINSISFDLRNPINTSLGISLITEEQDILQKLLLNLSK